MFEAGLD